MSENFFNNNPLKVAIFNPVKRKIKSVYTFISKNITKQFFNTIVAFNNGKNVESQIKAFYGKKYLSKLYINKSIEHFFIHSTIRPEETINGIKLKIWKFLNIPIYKQYLFIPLSEDYKEGPIETFNRLEIRKNIFISDIRETFSSPSMKKVFDLPIDNLLVEEKEDLRIISFDHSHYIGKNSTIFLVDLDDVIDPVQMTEIPIDDFIIDVLWYGCICKFWPMFIRDAFSIWCRSKGNDGDVIKQFPKYLIHHDIDDEFVDKYIDKTTDNQLEKLEIGITKAVLRSEKFVKPTMIKTVFNNIDLNECGFLAIKILGNDMKVTKNLSRVRNNKKVLNFLKKEDEYVSKGSNIIVILAENFEKITLNKNGNYEIIKSWDVDNFIQIDDAKKILLEFAYKLDKIITKSGILETNKPDEKLYNIHVKITWPLKLSRTQFLSLYETIKNLSEIQIINNLSTLQFDKFSFNFYKFMSSFTQENLEKRLLKVSGLQRDVVYNPFSYLFNDIVYNKWSEIYSGKKIEIKRKINNIFVSIDNVSDEEIKIICKFLYQIFISVPSDSVSEKDQSSLLDRLKQYDPELYDFQVSNVKELYSRRCQKPKQPIIYNPDEIKALPNDIKKSLMKFWNFTEKTDAYYYCPNREYPVPGFQTEVNPKGYCVVCCQKSLPSSGTFLRNKHEQCLENFLYEKKERYIKHILSFGKIIEPARLSHLPDGIRKIIGEEYKIIGVEQHSSIGSVRIGLLYSISKCLMRSPEEIVVDISQFIDKLGNEFVILNDNLQIISDPKSFVQSLFEMISGAEGFSRFSPSGEISNWESIFISLVSAYYDVQIFKFVGVENFDLVYQFDKLSSDPMIVLFDYLGYINPIVYGFKFEVKEKILVSSEKDICLFNKDMEIFKFIKKIVKSIKLDKKLMINEPHVKYIGTHGLIYGNWLKESETFLPIPYEPNTFEKDVEIMFSKPPRSKNMNKIESLGIKKHYFINHDQKNIGFMDKNNLAYYVDSVIPDDNSIEKIIFPYDPDEINESISLPEIDIPIEIKKSSDKIKRRIDIYNIFKVEFNSVVKKYYTGAIREKINETVKNNFNNFKAEITKNEELSEGDKNKLLWQFMLVPYKDQFLNLFSTTFYEFDKNVRQWINSLDPMKPEIKRLMSDSVIIVDKEPEKTYTEDRKIQFTNSEYDEIIDLFIREMNNPFMTRQILPKYLEEDPGVFTKRINEDLDVYY